MGPNAPIVTTALKSPLAIRSTSCSISWSVEDGELRIVYVECGIVGSGRVEGVDDCAGGGGAGGGSSEKRDGEGAIKERY